MKSIVAAALALSVMTSPARAADLSPEEQSYVVIILNTLIVAVSCDGYTTVNGSGDAIADQIGIGADIAAATGAAIKMGTHQDYDRNLLIPEVTRFVNHTSDAIADLLRRDKQAYCRQYAPLLMKRGTLERK
ncbi:hypothetical protein [Bradyrhizobium erythrophlei]|uniref:Rap1a immunity protein domain-containing protein n=1 Tax=Bradyrhizobium erythrophlei TaxID=1437360 RepID=A0A1M5NHK7_9BRAD|nr:hypothetical protein [Bradyrhizobium erythrophlei]SHG88443.1 hypothetical protein SAMN05443248_2981 [Bradyrhizobium erythrophlei]